MKRVVSLLAAIVLLATLLPLGTVTYAVSQEVTLSAGGSLADALKEVADGGTIRVDGTVSVTAAPGTHGKTVTITGGELDFTSLSSVTLGDHITFDDITLTFTESTYVYAGGYKVTMGSGVTMTNPIKIFGGKNGGTVASTNLTLLAGTYTAIYGGSHKGNVTGSTYLYVGGNVNPGADASSHSHDYCIYGGSYIASGSTGSIGGTAYTVFTGSAKANYIYGGSYGASTISGGTNLTVSGGSVMSVYGANRSGSFNGDVKLLISGGTMEQVFGGSEGGAVTGDVALDITGGTITRRVYGGCYNEVDVGIFSETWNSSYYVTGKIVLTLHSGASITFSSSSSDRAIYAHSRQATLSSTEMSHLVYADSTAYANYNGKVGAQDSIMKSVMSGVSVADHIHYHTYTASGAVITQKCETGGCSGDATATLAVPTASYTGSAVEPGSVAYSSNWWGGDLDITYTNNVEPGTGTASITCGGVTVSQDFTITRDKKLYMNGTGYASLEEAIAAARKTSGADTITLWEDVEVASWLVFNTEVTLTANEAVTITAADTQTGSMFRVIGGGKLTIEGASEDAKITIKAGVNTTNVIVNNGGDIYLTNVELVGNENTTHTRNNKACGIFNDDGTVTAKSVDVVDMVMGDGIYALAGTTVNLDNVTVTGSGRYGIKVTGTVNISNTVHPEHALSVSNSADNAIDIENGGKLVSSLSDVPADTYAIRISGNTKKGIHVRGGGSVELSHVSVADSGTYGICFSRNGSVGATGSISDFEVSGAGDAAVYLAAYSNATMANGTITATGCCVKSEATSILTVSGVTAQTSGSTATVIKGTLNGEFA